MLQRWRVIQLVLLVAAALLASVAATASLRGTGAAKALGLLAGAVLATTSIIQARMLTGDAVATWVDGRRTAEALKAAVFTARAQVAPYDDTDAAARLRRLADRSADGGPGPPDAAALAGARSSALSGTDYLSVRTRSQRRWHEDGGRIGYRRAQWLRMTEVLVSVAAAAAAAASGFVGRFDLAQAVGTLTTVGAAVAAHLAAGQHAETAVRYTATARRLGQIEQRFTAAGPLLDESSSRGQAARQALVDETEAVLAAQNGGWAADLGAA